MKIYNPANLGLFLALLSSTQVAAQSCSTLAECPDDTYCNSLTNTCMEIGGCVEVSDCDDPTNGPFPMAMCIGRTTCVNNLCGIDCTTEPAPSEEAKIQPLKCSSNEECPVDLNGMQEYCASDGYCTPQGGCATVEDCGKRGNDFMMATCIGEIICQDRQCGIECDTGCDSAADCGDGEFCAADGVCERIGGCAIVDDCWKDENQGYPIATCLGTMECKTRTCGMNCSGGSDALFPCQSSKDCTEPESYCNSYEICRKNGSCVTDADCSMPGNFYPEIECIGKKYCDESGMCAKVCGTEGEPEPLPQKCTSSDQCSGDDEYCAGNGLCLKHGACDKEGDCTNRDNAIFFPACVGTIYCEEGQCGKVCDGGSPKEEIPDAVELEIQCKRDEDCSPGSITTSTARSAPFDEPMYCAQGICKKQGYCISDSDCMNPSNTLWPDKFCMGYLHCTREGKCDRVCGDTCKNGSTAAQCFADTCEVNDWSKCEEAVSCVMTTCDEKCGWMLFNEEGKELLPDCGLEDAATLEDLAISKDANGGLVAPDTSSQSANLESSATIRAASVAASLAVAFAVAMV